MKHLLVLWILPGAFSCPGADTDERWGANPERIPEIGTTGTLLIRPAGADRPVKNDAGDVSR